MVASIIVTNRDRVFSISVTKTTVNGNQRRKKNKAQLVMTGCRQNYNYVHGAKVKIRRWLWPNRRRTMRKIDVIICNTRFFVFFATFLSSMTTADARNNYKNSEANCNNVKSQTSYSLSDVSFSIFLHTLPTITCTLVRCVPAYAAQLPNQRLFHNRSGSSNLGKIGSYLHCRPTYRLTNLTKQKSFL